MNLKSDVTELKYISSSYSSKLSRLGIETVKDLLTYFPRSYTDSSDISKISDIAFEDTYTIKGTVVGIKTIRLGGKRTMQIGKISDETGSVDVQFFNQPFLLKIFRTNDEYIFFGKSRIKGKRIVFYPSSYEKYSEESLNIGRISPEYRLTEGISKKWIRKRISELLELLDEEKLELEEQKELVSLESLRKYIRETHFPSNFDSLKAAREVLQLLELAKIHLKIFREEEKLRKVKVSSYFPKNIKQSFDEIFEEIPFELTKDQESVLESILENLHNKERINSLIQGDVGSGKTIIALITAYLFAKEGRQVALLAPTTVLAKQHYENSVKLFKFNKDITLQLVSSDSRENDKASILIGTTALLHRKSKVIANLDLLIVDEQHRFGVIQREELIKDNKDAHFINMTATPIPRTIAELLFKDSDVLTIKSKPKNRLDIKSFIVPKEKRENNIEWIRKLVSEENQQVYWICPLIEENDSFSAISVDQVYDEIKTKLPEINVEFLHGKMKNEEKQKIMKQFNNNKVQILISTTVIEVGVDVPNATVMVIENAERFGLAQLHQIRGRVGRGDKQSYCFLYTDPEASIDAKTRLEFFIKTNDGLKISEFDLERRGPGEVYGTKQSGIPDLKIANIMDVEKIKKSKIIAKKAYESGIRQVNIF